MKTTIGIAAPADYMASEDLYQVVRHLEQLGLDVAVADNVSDTYGRMAGSDAERAAGTMELCRDVGDGIVLFAMGGYGSNRILPLLDWKAIPKGQQWVGFSDATSMLNARIARTGQGGWHGPLMKQLIPGFSDAAHMVLKEILLGNPPKGYAGDTLAEVKVMKQGKARGRLVGGNLAVLRSLLGTPYAPVPKDGDILFVEDICETNFRLDRDLEQLAQAGWFEKLGGLIYGRFSDIEDSTNRPFGFTVEDIFERHAARVKGPVVCNFPAGHKGLNLPLPLGSIVELDAAGAVSLSFEGV